ncbi:MAG: RNA polymerase sigma factor [Candidatus Limnocylindria bacterium]
MGMARGETIGDRGVRSVGGNPVATLAISPSSAYTDHADALRAYLTAFTHDASAAEDLLHETYLRLLIEVGAGRPPTHLRAWLFRVAGNLATSRARREGVAVRRAPELLRHDVAPSPEDVLLDREAARSLTSRLSTLPEHVRMALLLSALGYSGAEIARRIGRSEQATRSLLCRQRSRLRADASVA